jgi:hypothetical protein
VDGAAEWEKIMLDFAVVNFNDAGIEVRKTLSDSERANPLTGGGVKSDPRAACSKEDPAWISRRARQAAGGMGDIWTDLGKALVRQAATQASIDAVRRSW